MTKSTITREKQRQILIDTAKHIISRERTSPHSENLRELARIALAAMDSESGCLPLDYLQGHKDGLEWAAQLAEANHPETGDWLYDDPIELAKAIRKGPDMPPAQPAPVVPPECVAPVSTPSNLAYEAGWNACRAAMLAAAQHDTPALNPVQSVVTVPGKWIPVSERMPELGDWLVTDGCDFDVQLFNGEQFIPGFVWEDKITHWMPLPAVPQEVKGE
ncbi:TPA: DUF551 domain-containing protein [Klebsiella pneumoniae]|nr:DUF551 domain-containing protein [Klebsiella pneumoniae]